MLKEKGEKKEIYELENGKHSTFHSKWQGTTSEVVNVHWQKGGPAQKNITLWIEQVAPVTKNEATVVSQ